MGLVSDQINFPIVKKHPKIWWNDDCRKAVKDKKKARNRFQKHPSQEALISMRRAESLV